MSEQVITDYHQIARVLADRSMRQALYDEGGVVMDDVLLTLHGPAHHKRRVLEFSILRKDYFAWYEAEVFPPRWRRSWLRRPRRGGWIWSNSAIG